MSRFLDKLTARLAGVPYAALPLGIAASLEMGVPLIYPRKEVKSHGRGKQIEGEFQTGDRVIVIEDLVTTAGSLIQSIDILRDAGRIDQAQCDRIRTYLNEHL